MLNAYSLLCWFSPNVLSLYRSYVGSTAVCVCICMYACVSVCECAMFMNVPVFPDSVYILRNCYSCV